MSNAVRLKDTMSDLLSPHSGRVEGFLAKLSDESIKLSNLFGVVNVIDRDYRSPVSGPHPSGGFFSSDVAFTVLLSDKAVGKELEAYLAGCVRSLKESRPDLVAEYPKLFS